MCVLNQERTSSSVWAGSGIAPIAALRARSHRSAAEATSARRPRRTVTVIAGPSHQCLARDDVATVLTEVLQAKAARDRTRRAAVPCRRFTHER